VNLDPTGLPEEDKEEVDGVGSSAGLSMCSVGGFNLFERSVKLRDKNIT
jgi:hypothetical protein